MPSRRNNSARDPRSRATDARRAKADAPGFSARGGGWLAALDDFRNWVSLGFQPAKRNENPRGRIAAAWSGEIELTSGTIEAEQLSGPERARLTE
jgi:hypothetical protein